jgi:asparagine synthase (glutamine-hydrolysing)
MCGIGGGWLFAATENDVEATMQALAHRGPDGHGRYVDRQSGVSLVHTRLAIIDLSDAGHQPMASQDGDLVLVFNGEIYNYRELRAELEAEGVAFRGHSDTEVLLELYRKYGTDALPKLNGIFAFALHDRVKGELLLVRDALGVKPLYVAEGEHGFAFASEIKAMLPLLGQHADIDHVALHRYLSFLWCPGAGTPTTAVRKLEPGQAMVVVDGRVQQHWTWYQLPVHRPPRHWLNEPDSIKAVQEGLRAAVLRQLVADVPVGAFLSGGLDSSAIVAFAREAAPELRCFTIESGGGADDGQVDDLPYARRVAKHLGVALDVVQIDPARMISDLEQMIWQLDEPLADPAPLNVLYISQLARSHGIKVLLSGAGGDDLFTGYRRHLALRYESLWAWLPQTIRAQMARVAAGMDQRKSLGQRLNRLFGNAADQGDVRLAQYFAWARRDDLFALYTSEMKAMVGTALASQPMLDFLAGLPADVSRMERLLALEQRFFLADHNLNYTDKMSMAAGVEVRVPFLDLELVEVAANIPEQFKQRGRIGKWVLKKAMEPWLPRDVIYRPKTGFGAPLRRWMRNDLRELLGDLLSEQSLRRRGLFDPLAVQQLIADNDAGRKDASYTLLSLLSIEIWCRRFLSPDKEATQSIGSVN